MAKREGSSKWTGANSGGHNASDGPGPEMLRKMHMAAVLLIRGHTWASISKELGYKTMGGARVTVVHKHPEVWNKIWQDHFTAYCESAEIKGLANLDELEDATIVLHDGKGNKTDSHVMNEPTIRARASQMKLQHLMQLKTRFDSTKVEVEASGDMLDKILSIKNNGDTEADDS